MNTKPNLCSSHNNNIPYSQYNISTLILDTITTIFTFLSIKDRMSLKPRKAEMTWPGNPEVKYLGMFLPVPLPQRLEFQPTIDLKRSAVYQ